MTANHTKPVSFTPTTGKLPPWLWRELFAAQESAPAALNVLVVNDGRQAIVVMPLRTYQMIIDELCRDNEAGGGRS